ncbi:MAG: hypothetical protein JWM04_984 [Verrucomicrobiales bacterium]|nr:hypothetical protein [Verrucomicrobiales bacterium]
MKKCLSLSFIALTLCSVALAQDALSWKPGIKTLIVGGGSSHDFEKYFHRADQPTLEAVGASVNYTTNIDLAASEAKNAKVLYLSQNQTTANAELRKTIMEWPSSKGMLLVHPALWYNWKDWPQYNSQMIGGGAKSHDKYGEFEVTVDKPNHPLTKNVPAQFKISDELYHFEKDPSGSQIEVLATGKNLVSGQSFPVLWIVHRTLPNQTDEQKIVCITLGHDDASHSHPAYKQILQNSWAWAAGK